MWRARFFEAQQAQAAEDSASGGGGGGGGGGIGSGGRSSGGGGGGGGDAEEEYRELLMTAWSNGSLARGEGTQLAAARRRLNVTIGQHRQMMAEVTGNYDGGV